MYGEPLSLGELESRLRDLWSDVEYADCALDEKLRLLENHLERRIDAIWEELRSLQSTLLELPDPYASK